MELTFRNINTALPELCRAVLHQDAKPSRNGETRELRFPHITLLQPLERYVVVEERHANLAAQIIETCWVLSGKNDVETLLPYLPRAVDYADDGERWRGGYGPRIRSWDEDEDQLAHVVDLLTDDPYTRRAVIAIYNPSVDMSPGRDIPCNDMLHFLARDDHGSKVLDLHVFTRSNDLMWGWSGINAFEWSVLLELVAWMTDMEVGQIHFSISSLHLYAPYYKKAERIVAAGTSVDYAAFGAKTTIRTIDCLDDVLDEFWRAEQSIRYNAPDMDMRIEDISDPMFRQWARVIKAWWYDRTDGLPTSVGIWRALAESPKRKVPVDEERQQFLNFVTELDLLHQSKDAAYGNSWIKRGVVFSAMPNICRKVDRLEGGTDTPDETQLDTAEDLLIYVTKLHVFLVSRIESGPEHCKLVRQELANATLPDITNFTEIRLIEHIGNLVERILKDMEEHHGNLPYETLKQLGLVSMELAYNRWLKAQHAKADKDQYQGADHE